MARLAGRKSEVLQLALTLLLGPIGLLYSSPVAGIALFFAAIAVGLVTGGYGALLAWPIAIVTGVITVRGRNRRLAAPFGAQRGERGTTVTEMPNRAQDEAAQADWEHEGGRITTPPYRARS